MPIQTHKHADIHSKVISKNQAHDGHVPGSKK